MLMETVKRYTGLLTSANAVALVGCVAAEFWKHRQFYPALVSLANSELFCGLLCSALALLAFFVVLIAKFFTFGNLRFQEREEAQDMLLCLSFEGLVTFALCKECRPVAPVVTLCSAFQVLHCLLRARLDFVTRGGETWRHEEVMRIQMMRLRTLAGALMTVTVGWVLITFGESKSVSEWLTVQHLVLLACWSASSVPRLYGAGNDKVCSYAESTALVCRYASRVLIFFAVWHNNGFPLHLVFGTVTEGRALLRCCVGAARTQLLRAKLDLCVKDAPDGCGETCVICFDPVEDCGKELECGHHFHKKCLWDWLVLQPACPYCRREVDLRRALTVRLSLSALTKTRRTAQIPAAPASDKPNEGGDDVRKKRECSPRLTPEPAPEPAAAAVAAAPAAAAAAGAAVVACGCSHDAQNDAHYGSDDGYDRHQ
eukprot:Hpha_TRINITY_DN16307_c2_g7::TRINITY_DN16307_c2_g7_i1::g.59364::m.59364/K10601/SYVN1, HRD1; E3 ubiquitin-protein ligase synoviolin